ncbi:MAG: M3 family oligoendopeptidase [Firmicutes bacterium]|nr:M3 family oligoendopeptidase [Bacillota bacterium]
METNWTLDPIYKGIDDAEFLRDLGDFPAKVEALNSWARENLTGTPCAEVCEEYINRKNALEYYSTIGIYLQLGLSVDTENAALQRLMDKYEGIAALCAVHEALFLQWIKGCGDFSFIQKSDTLKQHEFFIREQAQLATHTLSPDKELIISRLKTTGSTAWQKLWEQASSTADVEYNGEVLTLSQIRALADNSDPDVRKNAYLAELAAYPRFESAAAFAMNGIKGEVLTTSEMRGYDSALDEVLLQSRIDRKILDALLDAVNESLPAFRRYFDKKAEVLGDKNGLEFCDIFAPINDACINYTLDGAKQAVLDAFYGFDRELGAFAENEFAQKRLDLLPKKGKVGGAFSEAVHGRKQGRYLINFTGSFNDAVTIAHELGHGYHSHLLFENSFLNSDYPMPIAETASTLCENIFINHAMTLADEKQQIYILETDIQGAAQTLVDIYSRFLFEDRVFELRREGSLSARELCDIMTDAQKRTYGRLGSYHPYMWACKPHYYDADYNYYNFPYAFGMLLSKGLYAKYLRDREGFMPMYNKMLAATGSMKLADVAGLAGIDLYSRDFWLSGVKLITQDIDRLIKML